MHSLSRIIDCLKESELNLVRHLYSQKPKEGKAEQNKRLQLFELIASHKCKSDDQLARQLGYPASNASYVNLKNRLRADILNIMLMQESTQKFSTPYAQAQFDCRRQLMHGELLMSRGIYEEAVEILGKAARTAARFELFAEQLLIEDLLRNHVALHDHVYNFENISKSIEMNYQRMGEVLRAKRHHYEIATPRLLRAKSANDYQSKGIEVLRHLEDADSLNTCSRISFYRHLASLNYYSAIRNFSQAEKHAQTLLNSVDNDPVICSNANKAGISMEMANICMQTGRFEEAYKHADLAARLFKPGMLNNLQASVLRFFALFRQDKLDESEQVLNELIRHRVIKDKIHPGMISRVHLLKAALSFRTGLFDDVVHIVHDSVELLRHAESWLPGYMLLDTIATIEMKSYEMADYRLDAFRKTVHRHGYDREERRISVILKLLRSLLRNHCNTSQIVREHVEEVQLLTDSKQQYHWNPTGYEVIRFDRWLTRQK